MGDGHLPFRNRVLIEFARFRAFARHRLERAPIVLGIEREEHRLDGKREGQ